MDYDGDYDMLLHFKTQELKFNEDSTEAGLKGKTHNGIAIIGTDSVKIVPKGKGLVKVTKDAFRKSKS